MKQSPLSVVKVELELQRGSDPIEGTLSGPDAEPRRFHGWLELSTLLLELTDLEGSGQAGDGVGRTT